MTWGARGIVRDSAAWPIGLGWLSALAVIAVAIAVVASASRPALVDNVPADVAAAARSAEADMTRAASVIERARQVEGIATEAPDAGPMSALIGAELTPITTTLGNLEAKRVSTSAAWAHALTLRLHRAGLRRGDAVAAGLSGSFPGLNLALTVACRALGVRLVAVSSVTASSWGANQPGFTWPEMEERLVAAGVIARSSIAIAVGGAGDRGLDLEPEGRGEAQRIARAVATRLAVPLLAPSSFEQSVRLRLDAYERASAGAPIRLYANVGGTEASLGRSPVVLRLPNGFLPGVPFDLSRGGGVMARFAARGVPLLTLLNVRDLAVRWGIL